VERRGDCSSVVEARGHVPYAARVTPAGPGWARVVLVQTIAGPLAGDRTAIEVEVRPGAALEVVGNAATLAFPCSEPARHEVRIRVGRDARLAWLPEPLILASGCHFEASVELELATDAAAITRELVVLGRHGEDAGRYRSSLRCELDVAPLLHDTVELEQAGVGLSSPAVLAGAAAFASVALLGIRPDPATDPDELALAGPGAVLRALGPDAASVHARIAPVEAAYRSTLASRASRDSVRLEDVERQREDQEEKHGARPR
jgi:urease accessory protein